MTETKRPQPSAYTQALALLGRREHSRRELRTKLLARGLEEDEVDQALQRLAENGFQSEHRFAELLARSRIAQGHGPIRVLAELRQHGIDEADAQAAMEAESPDWLALAQALCQRRFRGPAGSHAEQVRRANFLARRGFPSAIARSVAMATSDEFSQFD